MKHHPLLILTSISFILISIALYHNYLDPLSASSDIGFLLDEALSAIINFWLVFLNFNCFFITITQTISL